MKKSVFDDEGRGLKEYKRKRDFRQTAEPPPRVEKKRAAKELMFVIQKHDATRLHYDFRLEMEGVLKSWAVPKGLPTVHGDRRLAVHVEDHPMDYARFEGTIPEGNYGAGTVMVWDIGTYSDKSGDPLKALQEGKLHLTLKGKKLKGDWTFVQMKPRPGDDKDNWLIFKSGEEMKPLSAKEDDESILTHRSMAQIASQNKAQWQSHRAAAKSNVDARIAKAVATRKAHPESEKKGAAKRASTEKREEQTDSFPALPTNLPSGKLQFIEPMKCKLVEEPPEGKDWIYEIKFDGFRALALKDNDRVTLLSRNNKSLNDRFPEAVDAVRKLPFKRGILDGEIVALDEEGRTSFQLLQMANMPGHQKSPIVFYVFDVLNVEGKDVKNLVLRERKEILQSVLGEEHEPVRFSASIHGDPKRLLAEIRTRGLEGIIAKNLTSKYEAGLRTGCWRKIKVVNEQEFVIGGFTPPKGSRDHFGAILVGYFEGDRLIFVSKVGSGFNQEILSSLNKKFQKLRRTECPFVNLPEKRSGRFGQGLTASEMRKCTWVEPELIAEIRFTEWTRDNHLRHPVFLGLRDDLKPRDVRKEKAS